MTKGNVKSIAAELPPELLEDPFLVYRKTSPEPWTGLQRVGLPLLIISMGILVVLSTVGPRLEKRYDDLHGQETWIVK